MNALREIGYKKILKFLLSTVVDVFFSFMILPPMRVWFLRAGGASIGKDVVIHSISFMNLYRGSFKNLIIGDNSFLGQDVLLDLADTITLGKHVTVGPRTIILTHLNVGYKDHPLQKHFSAHTKATECGDGVFIGVQSTLLAGVKIGVNSMIGAHSLVREDVPEHSVYAGVPAKKIRGI